MPRVGLVARRGAGVNAAWAISSRRRKQRVDAIALEAAMRLRLDDHDTHRH
jgi:hypothetical protein